MSDCNTGALSQFFLRGEERKMNVNSYITFLLYDGGLSRTKAVKKHVNVYDFICTPAK